jgi:hypothetical protein
MTYEVTIGSDSEFYAFEHWVAKNAKCDDDYEKLTLEAFREMVKDWVLARRKVKIKNYTV